MPLTDVAIRSAKPRERSYKLTDGQGMYLEVMPIGAKYWRLKCRIDVNGKPVERRLALGVYPTVSLLAARKARDEAKDQLRAGLDPTHEKRCAKVEKSQERTNSFEALGRDWYQTLGELWIVRHADFIEKFLERELFPLLGIRPVREITASELLMVMRKIESRDALELHAMRCRRPVRYFGLAWPQGVRSVIHHPTCVRGALKTCSVTHMKRIGESEIPELMRKIAAYDGEPQTRLTMELLALTFVRIAELRFAEWNEIDEKS